MSETPPRSLFSAYGVELEYMIVAADSLDVRPIADEFFRAVGAADGDAQWGPISWSNELAAHVVELKTTEPAPSLAPLPAQFQENVRHVNRSLAPLGARLLPTAMHPWMDPVREMRLWPGEYSAVYAAFDRIFDCRGHGWANLQSVHLNLPFQGDEEFGRLHAAIRLVLPLLPALAASSPVCESRLTGYFDTRLEVYRHNSRRIPRVAGQVIPEPAFSRAAYYRDIFEPLFADMAPHDPEQALVGNEWLNARGAIARFDRGSIEIRVLDVQECPQADVALCAAIVAVLQATAAERWSPLAAQQAFATEPLAQLFVRSLTTAEDTVIDDADFLRLWGIQSGSLTMGELWRRLLDEARQAGFAVDRSIEAPVQELLAAGPLARRIARALGSAPDAGRLRSVYAELADCLHEGRLFVGRG